MRDGCSLIGSLSWCLQRVGWCRIGTSRLSFLPLKRRLRINTDSGPFHLLNCMITFLLFRWSQPFIGKTRLGVIVHVTVNTQNRSHKKSLKLLIIDAPIRDNCSKHVIVNCMELKSYRMSSRIDPQPLNSFDNSSVPCSLR